MLPGETNELASTGLVLGYEGEGEALQLDTMSVLTADLAPFAGMLVGRTLEVSSGQGRGRFWQILGAEQNGEQTVLTLQNPGLPSAEWAVPAPGASEFAISSLSANFFVEETTQVDFVFVNGQLVVEDGRPTGALLLLQAAVVPGEPGRTLARDDGQESRAREAALSFRLR